MFSRFGWPRHLINSGRGTLPTVKVRQELWCMFGVQNQSHVSYHPMLPWVEKWGNQTGLSFFNRVVMANQKEGNIQFPLRLLAIRATSHATTKVSPFKLMTGQKKSLPSHLLYQPGGANLSCVSNRRLSMGFHFGSTRGDDPPVIRKTSHWPLKLFPYGLSSRGTTALCRVPGLV